MPLDSRRCYQQQHSVLQIITKKTHFASLIPHFKETLLNDKANDKSTEEYRSADLDDASCATS